MFKSLESPAGLVYMALLRSLLFDVVNEKKKNKATAHHIPDKFFITVPQTRQVLLDFTNQNISTRLVPS